MTSIKSVTMNVETSDGGSLTLMTYEPGPRGDNPRFLEKQLMAGADLLIRDHVSVLTALHGDQIPVV